MNLAAERLAAVSGPHTPRALRSTPQAEREALRDELTRAWWNSPLRSLRFRPAPVEVTVQVAAADAGEERAGTRWGLVELGGGGVAAVGRDADAEDGAGAGDVRQETAN